jgi:hypothetical protein
MASIHSMPLGESQVQHVPCLLSQGVVWTCLRGERFVKGLSRPDQHLPWVRGSLREVPGSLGQLDAEFWDREGSRRTGVYPRVQTNPLDRNTRGRNIPHDLAISSAR